MTTLRQLGIALALTIVLAITAFAGQMDTGIAPPSPPATLINGEMETGITGQMDTGSGEATAADSATEVALNLFQSVLAFF